MFYQPKWRALAIPFMLFFTLYALFSHFHLFFILFGTFFSTLMFFLTSYSFFLWMAHSSIHSAIHSTFCGKIFIQQKYSFFAREAIFKFQISFFQKCTVSFIQKNYNVFGIFLYRTGLSRAGLQIFVLRVNHFWVGFSPILEYYFLDCLLGQNFMKTI